MRDGSPPPWAEPFELDGRQSVQFRVNIGVSIFPNDGDDADTLLKNANMGLIRSKSEGCTCSFFDRSMDAAVQERRNLEIDLRRALINDEFELHYQPQVHAMTQVITGCEALVRWHHPRRGMLPPSEFIPLAEQLGIIVPLGAWVIQQACRDASTWPNSVGVAVNLSPAQFRGMALLQTVVAALVASGLSPARLELEITESTPLANNGHNIRTLGELRALGVRIAMDDFGIGYSSLSYLRVFAFDKVKIDRSFIEGIDRKSECSAIVRAMASLGAELGMTVTAEGVETLDQLRLIRDHGCSEVQGFFIGRPCPASAIHTFFKSEGGAGLNPSSRLTGALPAEAVAFLGMSKAVGRITPENEELSA